MENIIRQSVGIDMSNDDFHACFYLLNIRGESKRKGRVRVFKNTPSGFKNLIDWIEKKTGWLPPWK